MNSRAVPYIQPADMARAKDMLREGASLSDAAKALGVLTRDLDLALWEWLGANMERFTREPMF